ncbi:NADP(H)-dependent aldo-keto reductase [Bacteriovorax sp. Seq25_V]|uniref:NADP(H)-dependent aldo-keto reductase n=1 Tax=Bacteriovorax sp. Seq25_V TaxID=1201288 RepID=UPI000389E907|nr:NADP(H)-dependent aldo-keto reductase [Bacteriovorax sp. Seq25_V]EQC43773.1 oxidoreductase, aldo/keto reductase family protein [Bacteriovorax sp. Seq25_V]
MLYRKLGNTNIDVSVICLGTMTWGEQNTQAEAHEQLDYALSQGVNFIDTAEMYPVPPMAETYSATETIIGNWEGLHKNRDKIVLASKVAGPNNSMPYIRDGVHRLNEKNIVSACDASLSRLKTDYIDLYQLHWPDRTTNYFGVRGYQHNYDEEAIEIEETLHALQVLIKAGKIRHIGVSNETPWGLMKFLEHSKHLNLPRVMSVQNPYSLLNRSYEVGMSEISIRENAGLLAYSPLGFGVLSGKYLGGQRPEGARLTKWTRFSRYNGEIATQATELYVNLARKHGLDPAQMALAYVNSRDFVTSNIIGATKMDQLESNIDSINIELSDEVISDIEAIHSIMPNPCP